MRLVMFYHSLVSDWNHGNAHFLRGIAGELGRRGHKVDVYESQDAWSVSNLVGEHGTKPIREFEKFYPGLRSHSYAMADLDLDRVLDGADVVIVHEWNDRRLVSRIGKHRASAGGYRLYFHDTHHRMVTARKEMDRYELEHYDGVLAYGRVLRDLYLESGRVKNAWVWHEAADTSIFHPVCRKEKKGDLIWIGNWGDGERSAELEEFLIRPAKALQLDARVHGVRYPADAVNHLAQSGIDYAGWLPNFEVPRTFGQYRATVHIPRRPYVRALPGIPTIRVFEALACGIPLVCSWWEDAEQLFRPEDFLVARNGKEMISHLKSVLYEPGVAAMLARNGLRTIQARHTCAHRVDELLRIIGSVGAN